MQDNSGTELKQQVWGTQYVDELLFVNHNRMFPFWVLQDSNYNVLGLVNNAGRLVERYEYTPYGQRTVYHQRLAHLMADFDGNGAINGLDIPGYSAGLSGHPYYQMGDFDGNGAFNGLDNPGFNWVMSNGAAPASDTATSELYPKRDSTESPTVSPYQGVSLSFARNNPLNDFGHQGLLHDKEFGLVYVRHRYLDPKTGRWITVDPAGYPDGMNRYVALRANTIRYLDPYGEETLYRHRDTGKLYTLQEAHEAYLRGEIEGPEALIDEERNRQRGTPPTPPSADELLRRRDDLEQRIRDDRIPRTGNPGPNFDYLNDLLKEVQRDTVSAWKSGRLGRKPSVLQRYRVEVNGCGPGWITEWVPASIRNDPSVVFGGGSCPFTSACDFHDRCYQTCNRDKKVCDQLFYDQMVSLCLARARKPCKCLGAAFLYYTLVTTAGGDSYWTSQWEQCDVKGK